MRNDSKERQKLCAKIKSHQIRVRYNIVIRDKNKKSRDVAHERERDPGMAWRLPLGQSLPVLGCT